jgi:acetyl esterase/lipase
MTLHSPLPRRPAPRRRALGGLLLVAVLALASACTASAGDPATPSPKGTNPATPAVTQPPTTVPEPDRLADPAIAPGECKVVNYTPPTAKDPYPGELCRPKENQRDVAVVVIHGGSGVGGSYANMRRWADRYLVEGYVTFLPGYPLFNPGSNESPVFPRPEQNIKAAVQFLRGTGNALGIRKDRIVVQGQSAGARIGAVGFTTGDDPWFAGPELYEGISDKVNGFIGFYHPYDGTMQFADQYFGGPEWSTDPKVHERLDKGDSLAHALNAVGPALFIVGDQDWNIITLQQDAFAQVLQANQHAATSVVVKGGGHGFDEGGNRLSKLGEESAVTTLTWLNDNFPQTPARPAQSADADVANAPSYSGVPPTTYQARPAPKGGYGSSKGGTKTGGGYVPPTTSAPATTSVPTTMAPTPTTAVPTTTPATTVAPTTSPPPPTTAPVTVKPTVPLTTILQ